MRRLMAILALTLPVALVAQPALACGGLVNPNGTVSLVRTTTLAAYVDGVEHYVTSFEFAGGGAEFGSIVPLPGVPTSVRKAGDWTLQRLVEEVTPQPEFFRLSDTDAVAGASLNAKELINKSIEALDITVLEGGGDAVGRWAEAHGFELTPDAPEVLDFYADRSPIFMAVRFDPAEARARGQSVGDGTPIHLAIPTPSPWVPLRILTLGLPDKANVEADVFLLTEDVPEMLPTPLPAGATKGMVLERSEQASPALLADLNSNKGMGWLPTSDLWFSYLRIDAPAGALRHDLAVDVSGAGAPSPVAAGLDDPSAPVDLPEESLASWGALAAVIALWGAIAVRNRPQHG